MLPYPGFDVAGSRGEIYAEEDYFLAASLIWEPISLIHDLPHGIFCRAVEFQLNNIDNIGDLKHQVHTTIGGILFTVVFMPMRLNRTKRLFS